MTTALDRAAPLAGYFPSHWPVECGGNHRQNAAPGGLNARGSEPSVTTSINDHWNVMMIFRSPHELYMSGTMAAFTGPPPFGWLQRLDADSQIITERKLPIDQAQNGLLVLSDGTIVTKDLRLANQGPSIIMRLDQDTLNWVGEPLAVPKGSIVRNTNAVTPDGEFIYIRGKKHVWRIRFEPERLAIDNSLTLRYRRSDGGHGLSWDS